MDAIDRDTLQRLAQRQATPCISLYMSTIRYESDLSQNPIRFKNLLKEARNQLRALDFRDDTAEELLQPAQQKLDDTPFWRNLDEGLAVFITPEATTFYRLPLGFEETAIVGGRFHLKPLFPLVATNNRFHLLALSQNDVRLYQGTHQAISEVGSSGIPSDIVEAIQQYEDPEDQLQQHTANRAGSRQDASFHGHGDADDQSAEPHDELKRFFRKIDDSLSDRLQGETTPLVLAGVREYLPLYREVNSYPSLVENEIVSGNPEQVNLEDLHSDAWSIVEPIFRTSQDEATRQFNQLYHQDGNLASDDFHEVVSAAAYSRVDILFVPIGRHRWGTFDLQTNTVTLHEDQEPGDEDLLDFAAVQAFQNGAKIYAMRPENMPGGRSIAATFRYAADVSATEG
jgi:hypothetical protein